MNDYMVRSNIREVFSVSSGVGLPQHKMNYGIYPVYGGNGVTGFHSDFIFEEKRLIIGRVGEHCGNIHITSKKAWITDNALIVYFKDNSEIIEFWYCFLCYYNLREFAFKGAQPVITGGVIKRLNILYVRKKEYQRKIAKILTTVDNLIEKTQTLIDKYQSIKQGMMHDLFTRGVDQNGKLRPTYEEAPHLYKESELGWIPKEWDVKPLFDFAINGTGIVNGPFGSDLLTSELQEEGVPVIYVRDVKPNDYRRISTAHVSIEKSIQLGFCNVKHGDVLLAKVGDPPCDAAPYFEKQDSIVTQDVIRIRKGTNTNTLLLSFLLNSSVAKKVIKRIIIEGTRSRVSLTEFKKIPLPMPPLQEQIDIGEKLSKLNDRITKETIYVQKLNKTKSGLMQDLLTGKKEVTPDPEDYKEIENHKLEAM